MAPPKVAVTVSTSGSLADDVYNAFSIRFVSLANRPVWIVNFTVDQISFYIGALGGIGMGYLMSQYDYIPNIHNVEYYNQEVRSGNTFMDLFSHIMAHPFHIIHRFFFSGTLYVLIGLATSRIIKHDGWGRPLVCGALTGLYHTYGSPITSILQGVIGFAAWSLLMEAALSYVVG